jgi:glucose-1-phosphate cytidylyltransferase
MVPVGYRPILWHTMRYYAHFGHKEFILCLGYKGEYIKEYFRNYQWNTSDVTLRLGRSPKITYHTQHDEEDWTVTLVDTGLETQTGGRLRRVMPYLDADNFLMTYGDGLINSDINASVRFHQQHGAVATLTAVQPGGRFGTLALDGDKIEVFHEKPEKEAGFVNGGFFVFNRAIEKYLGTEDSCVLEQKPFEKLAKEGQLRAYCHTGFWQCMDTFRESELLNKMWKNGDSPWKVW